MTAEARFWSYVDQGPECWNWTGSCNAGGYGQIRIDGTTWPAYRFAFELLVGPIPEGLCIDHLCRNRLCVNPAHLEAVTHRENCRRGAGTKLTYDDVVAIRSLVAGGARGADVATQFGISHPTVCDIIKGRKWPGTPGPLTLRDGRYPLDAA